uniref:LRRNT domain-containing protein n=1 Tax=Terrapene triunguis TaxID=2587831 RepID=A0A674I945_9SAUR
MQSVALLGVTTLALVLALAAPPKEEGEKKEEKPRADIATDDNLDLPNYDLSLDSYGEIIDLSLYEELYDYSDLAPKWRCELGRAREESVTAPIPARCCWLTAPSLPAPGLPTCLVCVCLGTSMYCDDAELEQIPPLPLETTYLYARFNRISRIRASDFARLKKLKRIDLTSNFISWVDEASFQQLSTLQELILAENRLTALPALPSSVVRLDARRNRIQSSGVRPEAFRELKKLQFLHLSDNKLDCIPVPLPEGLRSLHLQNNNIRTMHKDTFCDSQDHGHIRWALEDIRLDHNPINLSLFPDAYFCLPRLPTGHFY